MAASSISNEHDATVTDEVRTTSNAEEWPTCMALRASLSLKQQQQEKQALSCHSREDEHGVSSTIKEPDTNPTERIESNFHAIHASQVIATTTACIAAAFITYPAEMYRMSFTREALNTWNFESTHSNSNHMNMEKQKNYMQSMRFTSANISAVGSTGTIGATSNTMRNGYSLFNTFHKIKPDINPQKIRIVLSPLIRIFSHEIALKFTTKTLEKSQEPHESSLRNEITAGAIAGTCQALVLCPLEAHRANQLMITEQRLQKNEPIKHWMNFIKMQLFELGGAPGNPEERRRRAWNGVGVLAVREMVFNVTFFPIFHGLWRYFDQRSVNQKNKNDQVSSMVMDRKRTMMNAFGSGVLAGVACSLAVTPMDVLKTYMLHSREQWSMWTGRNVFGPPLQLLFRGLTVQAFVFGPTFGIVAAIYELTE